MQYDGQYVTADGEQSITEKLEQLEGALGGSLDIVRSKSPSEYEELMMQYDIVKAHFATSVLAPLGMYIKESGQTEFAKKYFRKLLNDDSLSGFAEMNLAQASYLASVIKAISDEKISWKNALKVSELDGGKLDWSGSLAEWESKAEKDGDDKPPL